MKLYIFLGKNPFMRLLQCCTSSLRNKLCCTSHESKQEFRLLNQNQAEHLSNRGLCIFYHSICLCLCDSHIQGITTSGHKTQQVRRHFPKVKLFIVYRSIINIFIVLKKTTDFYEARIITLHCDLTVCCIILREIMFRRINH